jgi:hypothetical protein
VIDCGEANQLDNGSIFYHDALQRSLTVSNDGHVTDVSPTVHQGPDLCERKHVSCLMGKNSSSVTRWMVEDGEIVKSSKKV